MVRTMRLRWVVVGTAPGHPLAPFVIGHKRQGKDDEGENGEGKLHKGRVRGQGSGSETRDQWACFMGEDSLRRVRSASRAAQMMRASRITVSM